LNKSCIKAYENRWFGENPNQAANVRGNLKGFWATSHGMIKPWAKNARIAINHTTQANQMIRWEQSFAVEVCENSEKLHSG
jgi:hypothetical protein